MVKKRVARENQPELFTNYSSHTLTPGQKSLLNKGPNFCITSSKCNKTEVKVSNFRWGRCMLWREFFNGREGGDGEDLEQGTPAEDRIIKDPSTKTNLPKGHSCPVELKNCIAATQYDILTLPLRKVRPNITKEETVALRELKELVRRRVITIRRSDKAGGWVITDFQVYKEAGDNKLKETFVDEEDGEVKAKYKVVTEAVLKTQHRDLQEAIQEGVEKGYICKEDGKVAVPETPQAARFYMNSKDHKQPQTRPLGFHHGERLLVGQAQTQKAAAKSSTISSTPS